MHDQCIAHVMLHRSDTVRTNNREIRFLAAPRYSEPRLLGRRASADRCDAEAICNPRMTPASAFGRVV